MLIRNLRRAPAAPLFMARALLPRRRTQAFPDLAVRLGPAATPLADVASYLDLTGLARKETLPLVWPQAWAFRLQMALLTDRAFPLPIWSALQVRNRMLQHAPLPVLARYALAVQTHRLDRLDKGVEVDLHSTLRDEAGRLAWESVTTFYWRGRGNGTSTGASAWPASPPVDGGVVAQWTSGEGSGWRFGALTGDYNGVHLSDTYARAFGFARAFHHPLRIAGQCLAHLAVDPDAPRQQLDLWFKGPVYYRSALALRGGLDGDARLFALHVDNDLRPALVGRWRREK